MRTTSSQVSSMPSGGARHTESGSTDFRDVFDGEFAYVWTSLRRLGVAPRDLEDVTHDVLFEVFRNLDRYDSARPLRPWLFAFAFRFASDYRRSARNRLEVYGASIEPTTAPQGEEAVAARESRALVAAALEHVDLARRAVFILHDIEEWSMREIAECLGVPLQTAYSRLHTARTEFIAAARNLQRGGP
jgi:RNA polymerase sigma-70 factor, ECF subfamily